MRLTHNRGVNSIASQHKHTLSSASCLHPNLVASTNEVLDVCLFIARHVAVIVSGELNAVFVVSNIMEQKRGNDVRKELNETHRNIINACLQRPEALGLQELGTWYEEYMAADADTLNPESTTISEVESDDLDEDAVEACILELAQEIRVKVGFCKDCQDLFDDWPDLSDPEVRCSATGQYCPGTGADWKHTVARNCHSLVLEAASRKGCKMCTLLVQVMAECMVLNTFRKIEARLAYLGATQTASLSVQNWSAGSNQTLWVNYPGKINESHGSGIARYTSRYSEALDPSGKCLKKGFINHHV